MSAPAGLSRVHARDHAPDQPELSFLKSEQEFKAALGRAVRRRLYPNTALHPKQLAHAIGVTERGLGKIVAGHSEGLGGTVAELVRFFWARGDRAIVPELYGLPPIMPVHEVERAIAQGIAALDGLRRLA